MSLIDRQKTFDVVAKHLLTQNEKSLDYGKCRYRGPGNLRCALGPLIPDDRYSPSMENCTLYTVGPHGDALRAAISYSLGVEHLEQEDLEFLNKLQQIHDKTAPDIWREGLTLVARAHELEMRV